MKKFGFGCMRLPMKGEQVDLDEFSRMIDAFMEAGFTYFDTAHGYVGMKSETALRECLTKRYPRDAYTLTNKLSSHFIQREEEIRPLFQKQLEACGVDYFDYYLMHAQTADAYQKYLTLNAYQVVLELKREGKLRHFGISFHDKADVLERILTEQPEIEVVQIQFNYADYEDAGIESRKCYEVCVKHGKPVIVMEPVKGGSLANLPKEGADVLAALGGGSQASYAVRFAASQPGVWMVLSGMSSMEQMRDNLSYMADFKPLNDAELAAIDRVRDIFRKQEFIGCTACAYCVDGCPKHIAIPNLFACFNAKKQHKDWNSDFYYGVHTQDAGKAKDCIACGKCEQICPQHLPIRELMKEVSKVFDKE